MASLFWVGGSTAYDGVTNTLATSTGGTATVAVINAADTVTFDANSPAAAAVTTSAAISCTTMTLAAGFTGSLTMSNSLTVSGVMTVSQGTFNTGNQTCSFGTFSSATTNTRSVTFGTSAVSINTSSNAALNLNNNTGLTVSIASSTITFTNSGGAAGVAAVGKTIGNVIINGPLQFWFQGGMTFSSLSMTGAASKVNTFNTTSSQTITGNLTLTGNSATNRIFASVFNSNLIQVPGSQATFTVNGSVSLSNVDFMDFKSAGTAGTWTGTSLGDCGGNSGITCDTPVTQTATGTASFTWSTHGWTSRVPLPQDNVVVNNAFLAGRTVTMDMPRSGANVDFSGSTGAPILSWGTTSIFGNLALAANNTTANANSITLLGRSSQTITTAGVTLTTPITCNAPGGTYTQQDNIIISASTATPFNLINGTWTANDFNIKLTGNGSGTKFSLSGGTINMGSGTFESTCTGGGINWSAASATINAGTSTIKLSGVHATSATFAGGGITYNNLAITGGSAGNLTFTGANTFANLPQVTGGTLAIVWPGSTTTTITNGGNFGNGSNVITMTASAGSATLAFGSLVNANFLNLTNIIAFTFTPAYAGTNSTDGGGNTNWTFTAAPAASSTLGLLGVG